MHGAVHREPAREQMLEVDTQYVNCCEDDTRFKCLYRVFDAVESNIDTHRQFTPTDELLECLRQNDGPSYVVILDEVNQLEDKRLPYDLNRIRDLELILISNSERELFAEIEPGALYEQYEQEVQDPLSKHVIRNHLHNLQHYNLIVAEGQT